MPIKPVIINPEDAPWDLWSVDLRYWKEKREMDDGVIKASDLLVSILPKEVFGKPYLVFNCCIADGWHVGKAGHEDDLAIMNIEEAKTFIKELQNLISIMEEVEDG